jgi:hypothetical protein
MLFVEAYVLADRGVDISRQMLDVLMKCSGERARLPEDKLHWRLLEHLIATHLRP